VELDHPLLRGYLLEGVDVDLAQQLDVHGTALLDLGKAGALVVEQLDFRGVWG
jgi:hypothetical protein